MLTLQTSRQYTQRKQKERQHYLREHFAHNEGTDWLVARWFCVQDLGPDWHFLGVSSVAVMLLLFRRSYGGENHLSLSRSIFKLLKNSEFKSSPKKKKITFPSRNTPCLMGCHELTLLDSQCTLLKPPAALFHTRDGLDNKAIWSFLYCLLWECMQAFLPRYSNRFLLCSGGSDSPLGG